jgi:methionyl-tRNA formyltransferase
MKTYVIASTKHWNVEAFSRRRSKLPGRWLIVTDDQDLTPEFIRAISPRYIFFMHWSSIVPPEISALVECVCFHMTDVPYGRGGSPLQNLILRGHKDTKLTALRMSNELDAGPVYRKLPLSLEGSAFDIFVRCAELGLDLIEWMVREEAQPEPQVGEPMMFRRREPAQSAMPEAGKLERIYDHIRMLDAESYPRAFLDHGTLRYTFSQARLVEDAIDARVRITFRNALSS